MSGRGSEESGQDQAWINEQLETARFLIREGDVQAAAGVCFRVLERWPGNAEAQECLGLAAFRKGAWETAVYQLALAAAARPDRAETRTNLGAALRAAGRVERAVHHSAVAIALAPGSPESHYNLANALQQLKRFDAAAMAYRRTIKLNPDHVEAHWNLSMACLRNGLFDEGWREYEWRWKRRGAPVDRLHLPPWDGGRLDGTLLLLCEQGIGDALQFARFLPKAASLARRVIVECVPPVAWAMAGAAPGIETIPRGACLPPVDAYASLFSLPRLFGVTEQGLAVQVPYLRVPPGPAPNLSAEGLKVGLTWAGSPLHPQDAQRSIPLQRFTPLAAAGGVSFFSLQGGGRAADIETIPEAAFVRRLPEVEEDLQVMARVIRQLDLVVTVDTSIAHLAGALGVPVWILLPDLPDWRWQLDRTDSPWYPTARLFRQTTPGNWDGVLSQVAAELSALVPAPRTVG